MNQASQNLASASLRPPHAEQVPLRAPLRRICPACSTENADDATFCDACGAKLSTPA